MTFGKTAAVTNPTQTRRALSVWLAVVALFLQLLVPSLHGRLLAATASPGEIVICTPQGIQHLLVDEDGSVRLDKSKTPSNTSDLSKNCPVCQAAHAGLGLPASLAPQFYGPDSQSAVLISPVEHTSHAADLWQRPATRAPPASI